MDKNLDPLESSPSSQLRSLPLLVWHLLDCTQAEHEERTTLRLEACDEWHALLRQFDAESIRLDVQRWQSAQRPVPQRDEEGEQQTAQARSEKPSLATDTSILEQAPPDTSAYASLLFSELNACMDRFWHSVAAMREKLPDEVARCVRQHGLTTQEGIGQDTHIDNPARPWLPPPDESKAESESHRPHGHHTQLVHDAKALLQHGATHAQRKPLSLRLQYGTSSKTTQPNGAADEDDEVKSAHAQAADGDAVALRLALARLEHRVETLHNRQEQLQRQHIIQGQKSPLPERQAPSCETAAVGLWDTSAVPFLRPCVLSVEEAIDMTLFPSSASSPRVPTARSTAAHLTTSLTAPEAIRTLCRTLVQFKRLYERGTATHGGTLETILSLPTRALPSACVEACVSYLIDASCGSTVNSIQEGLATMVARAAPFTVALPAVGDQGTRQTQQQEQVVAVLWRSYEALRAHALVHLLSLSRRPARDEPNTTAERSCPTCGVRATDTTYARHEASRVPEITREVARQQKPAAEAPPPVHGETALSVGSRAPVYNDSVKNDLTALEVLLASSPAPSAHPTNAASPTSSRHSHSSASSSASNNNKSGPCEPQRDACWWPSAAAGSTLPHRTLPTPYDALFPLPSATSAYSVPPPSTRGRENNTQGSHETGHTAHARSVSLRSDASLVYGGEARAPSRDGAGCGTRFFDALARRPQPLAQSYMNEEVSPTLRGLSQHAHARVASMRQARSPEE